MTFYKILLLELLPALWLIVEASWALMASWLQFFTMEIGIWPTWLCISLTAAPAHPCDLGLYQKQNLLLTCCFFNTDSANSWSRFCLAWQWVSVGTWCRQSKWMLLYNDQTNCCQIEFRQKHLFWWVLSL